MGLGNYINFIHSQLRPVTNNLPTQSQLIMPYRRLPNTDKSRIKALDIALSKGKELPPFELAFSQKSNQELQSFLNSFKNALTYYRQSYVVQKDRNKKYQESFRKARMYVSHFIQMVNMSIQRGELKPDIRKFYGLPADDSRIPALNTENDLIEWGERLIRGEAKRVREGYTPLTNPTIALVRVRYENFLEAHHHQKMLQKNTARGMRNLSYLKLEADKIILKIWNEVEESFRDLPDDLKRERAKEYGLVYVYRKNETGHVKFTGAQLQEAKQNPGKRPRSYNAATPRYKEAE